MSSCPHCQSELPDDFGLVQCGGCGASVFIDMDGQVSLDDGLPAKEATEEVEADPVIDALEPQDQVESPMGDPFGDDLFSESVTPESNPMPEDPIEPAEFEPDLPVFDPLEGEPEDELIPATEEASFSDQPISDFAESKPDYAPEDLSEISDFANSEVSAGGSGSLVCHVQILEIHGAEQRRYLEKLLSSDTRLGLDAKTTLEQVENGRLLLRDLALPVAVMLIKQLQAASLDVRWQIKSVSE